MQKPVVEFFFRMVWDEELQVIKVHHLRHMFSNHCLFSLYFRQTHLAVVKKVVALDGIQTLKSNDTVTFAQRGTMCLASDSSTQNSSLPFVTKLWRIACFHRCQLLSMTLLSSPSVGED
jgi:hypothetical protein